MIFPSNEFLLLQAPQIAKRMRGPFHLIRSKPPCHPYSARIASSCTRGAKIPAAIKRETPINKLEPMITLFLSEFSSLKLALTSILPTIKRIRYIAPLG